MPVGLREIAHERTPFKAPILFELADTIPSIVPDALQEFLRGIPGVKQDKSGLTLEPIARLTEQRQSQVVLGGTPFVLHTEGERNADLAVRPDEEDHRSPKEDLTVLVRPDPGGLAEEACVGFGDDGVIHDEIPASNGEQQA